MILDSSAIVAVLLRQPGHEALVDLVAREPAPGVGVPTLVESGIVLSARLGAGGRTMLARFVEEGGLLALPFEDAHRGIAIEAFVRFGKGRHPAALSFGDCLAYATAKVADEPLLALGDDFARTDLTLVDLPQGAA